LRLGRQDSAQKFRSRGSKWRSHARSNRRLSARRRGTAPAERRDLAGCLGRLRRPQRDRNLNHAAIDIPDAVRNLSLAPPRPSDPSRSEFGAFIVRSLAIPVTARPFFLAGATPLLKRPYRRHGRKNEQEFEHPFFALMPLRWAGPLLAADDRPIDAGRSAAATLLNQRLEQKRTVWPQAPPHVDAIWHPTVFYAGAEPDIGRTGVPGPKYLAYGPGVWSKADTSDAAWLPLQPRLFRNKSTGTFG